ncbi:MAG: hypothetical protein IKG69_03860 [Atopobiaceae bacterium]|nr:hypothetical protein [Atopobiaceae bacterium]
MPGIATDTMTLWRRVVEDEDHARWERHALTGVRVEPMRGSRAAQPGPTPSDALTAYVFADLDVRPGDRVACGLSASGEPTEGSYEVTDVRRYTLGTRLHHLEVEAR